MKTYMAFDIGGSFVKYGIVTEQAEIIKQSKTPTPKDLDSLIELIAELTQVYPEGKIEGLAISAPGAVSDSGIIYGFSALPYIHGPNVKELIVEKTGYPVYMENDANAAGYAEIWNGAGKGMKDVLLVILGTGVGGAVFKDGVIHKGANLHGGEFGYMLVDGKRTWSSTAATASLLRRVAEKKQVNVETLSGEEIFEQAEKGDPACQEAIEDFYRMIALGIYNLQYMYDPEVILIGGGISAREDLVAQVDKRVDQILKEVEIAKIKPSIEVCQHRQNANLLGAVYGFIHHLK
ncbi:ROK family protein [Radiobacillus kanasensis]|uniref:ROK family protein n=1 Tax=Radiobacillus kanasensis TaxID=2844358 RepID=UPI001E37F8C5|nr:ROK family protein [Radiobacillus kanasensis]UFU00383.1 ROK family protein [Radiobacillus kanasensis]